MSNLAYTNYSANPGVRWQNRPLEAVYPFVFLDAIHYKVNKNHQYQTKAAYVVLGITMDGTKDILGVWIGEHESSKFWLNVLNDLKSRGVLDVYLFCVDGLNGFVETIGAVYPHSQVQRCIVHQICSSTRFVSYCQRQPEIIVFRRSAQECIQSLYTTLLAGLKPVKP